VSIFYLVAAFLLNSFANIFLKIGANSGARLWPVKLPETLLDNKYLFFGLILFALNVFFYSASLKTLPLSVAYPVMVGMSFFLVNGYSAFWLGEKVTGMQSVGYVLIVLGIVVVTFFSKR
jgi:small multidrug resistance pump